MKTYTAVIERCPDTDLYVGYVPGFPGAHTQAESLDELNANLREVVEMLLADDALHRPLNKLEHRTFWLLTFGNSYPNILLCLGSTPPPWSDVAVPMRLGRPTGPGGLGPADDAHAQEGGGPVIEGKHGSVEVASS